MRKCFTFAKVKLKAQKNQNQKLNTQQQTKNEPHFTNNASIAKIKESQKSLKFFFLTRKKFNEENSFFAEKSVKKKR